MTGSRKQNIGNRERVARVVIGAALALLGVAVVASGPGFWGFVGAVLAVAAGLDFVVTGVRGYCPLYAHLGHVPRSLTGAAR